MQIIYPLNVCFFIYERGIINIVVILNFIICASYIHTNVAEKNESYQ